MGLTIFEIFDNSVIAIHRDQQGKVLKAFWFLQKGIRRD